MKSQANNKILPVKIIRQSLKEESSKAHISFFSKNTTNVNLDGHDNKPHNNAQTARMEHPQEHFNTPLSHRQSTKVISLGKNMAKKPISNTPKQIKDQIFKINPELNSKKSESVESLIEKAPLHIMCEPHINNYITPKQNRHQRQYFQHAKTDFSKTNKLKVLGYLQSLENTSLNLADQAHSKFQEETRYGSRCQNTVNYSGTNQKDQLKKIKAELYQQSVLVYQKNQELLQKQSHILQIVRKLDLTLEVNKNLRAKIQQLSATNKGQDLSKQSLNRWGQLQKALYQKSRQIECLNKQICDQKLQYIHLQQQNNNSFKLINLKLRQYEFQERELNQSLNDFRQKEKKNSQHNEKIINGINQLLKQKQHQLAQISQAAITLKQQNDQLNKIIRESQPTMIQPSDIIRELSAEISDLKQSLRNMQLRIRQMIQAEDEMRKQLQDQRHEIKILQSQRQQLQNINNQMHCTIVDLQHTLNKKQINQDKLKNNIAQFQQTHQKKHNNNSLLNKQQSNISFPSSKSSGSSSSKRSSSLCNGSCIDPVVAKRSGSCGGARLIKQNEHLSALYKECDRRLHQSYKLNGMMNEQIIKRDLKLVNNRLIKWFETQISQ